MRFYLYCITLAGILLNYASSAQVYLSPSVEIGTGYSTNPDIGWSKLDKVSYQNVSLNAGYLFHQKIGLFAGIGMSTYSHNFINWDGFSWLTVVEQNRLEIPLFFHYQTSKKQKVNFAANFGVKMGILTKHSAYNYDGKEMIDAGIDAHKTNFQQTTSLGVSFKIKKRNFIDIYLFHNLRLTEAYSRVDLPTTGSKLPSQINHFGIKTSFSWCRK